MNYTELLNKIDWDLLELQQKALICTINHETNCKEYTPEDAEILNLLRGLEELISALLTAHDLENK